MELRKLRLCGTFYDFDGIQGWIDNTYFEVALTPIGNDF